MKIPAERANAAEASLPTLVDAGREFFRMRLTQARGGSNSTAVGSPCGFDDDPAGVSAASLVLVVMALDAISFGGKDSSRINNAVLASRGCCLYPLWLTFLSVPDLLSSWMAMVLYERSIFVTDPQQKLRSDCHPITRSLWPWSY
jgi:hypothetical protein